MDGLTSHHLINLEDALRGLISASIVADHYHLMLLSIENYVINVEGGENMNEKGNVIGICKECGEDRRQKFQELMKNKEVNIVPGDFVKATFKEGEETEHMWVSVEKIMGFEYIGTLDNIPVLVKNVKYGQAVTVKHEDLCGYMSKNRKIWVDQ